MEPIVLRTKQDLDIYINPRRQNILRRMRIADEPMTSKQISDQIGISAFSVQFHLRKLLSLGVVERSHTETIHGITAKYYQASPRAVSIGLAISDGPLEQRLALEQNALAQIFSGYTNYCFHSLYGSPSGGQFGDMLYGISHLTDEEAKEIHKKICQCIQSHEEKTEESRAWEYMLITYPVPGKQNE